MDPSHEKYKKEQSQKPSTEATQPAEKPKEERMTIEEWAQKVAQAIEKL
jgi:hypothetical protein